MEDGARLIRVLVFDADGVVIDPPHRFMAYLQQELKVPPERSRRFFQGIFLECLVGQADLKEAIAPFLAEWGWSGSVEQLLQRWFEEEHCINDELVNFIQGLRKRGYACAVATNQERYRLGYMRDAMRLATLFDAVFGSAELGEMKPNAGFYRAVTERLGVSPEEILFWDDGEANVQGARAFGWWAERYTGFEGFVRKVRIYLRY